MEESKMQRLHDTLMKLKPNGNIGLGRRGYFNGKDIEVKDNGLPKNALYSRFVKEGHFKKKFGSDESDSGSAADLHNSKPESNGVKDRKRKHISNEEVDSTKESTKSNLNILNAAEKEVKSAMKQRKKRRKERNSENEKIGIDNLNISESAPSSIENRDKSTTKIGGSLTKRVKKSNDRKYKRKKSKNIAAKKALDGNAHGEAHNDADKSVDDISEHNFNVKKKKQKSKRSDTAKTESATPEDDADEAASLSLEPVKPICSKEKNKSKKDKCKDAKIIDQLQENKTLEVDQSTSAVEGVPQPLSLINQTKSKRKNRKKKRY